ncbi:MAG: hypothetical protein H6573_10200 [Lewinellaceae bacterium]|nr:hypothetical protein [Phaeodactylibacter sp.]MCB0615602.1 hypothetical protein [Phaeodactylibacter sp.]MCB9347866.1 hypothetical protein [Lewinellaceae bacterium]
MNKTCYKEEQRFRRWEVFALLALLMIGASYHFIDLYLSGGNDPLLLTLQYILIALILTGTLAYLWSIRLILKIDKEGIQYQFFPLHYRKHKIKWEEIENIEFIDTPLSAELSGWAVRLGTWERMFSVSGRTGLSLILKNGQQLFLGTQHPGELKAALGRTNAL